MHVQVNIQHESEKSKRGILEIELKDRESGKSIYRQQVKSIFKGNRTYKQKIKITNPKLWSPNSPNLYDFYVRVLY